MQTMTIGKAVWCLIITVGGGEKSEKVSVAESFACH